MFNITKVEENELRDTIRRLESQLIHQNVVITALTIQKIRDINSTAEKKEVDAITIPYQFLVEIGQNTSLEMTNNNDTLIIKPIFLKTTKEDNINENTETLN
jgi:hypothetical protein